LIWFGRRSGGWAFWGNH